MKIRQINFLPKFHKQWDALPKEVQTKARKTIVFFRTDPFHPSLRLHSLRGSLRGYWSISVDKKCRIILRIEGDIANFYSIGNHAIYGKM